MAKDEQQPVEQQQSQQQINLLERIKQVEKGIERITKDNLRLSDLTMEMIITEVNTFLAAYTAIDNVLEKKTKEVKEMTDEIYVKWHGGHKEEAFNDAMLELSTVTMELQSIRSYMPAIAESQRRLIGKVKIVEGLQS